MSKILYYFLSNKSLFLIFGNLSHRLKIHIVPSNKRYSNSKVMRKASGKKTKDGHFIIHIFNLFMCTRVVKYCSRYIGTTKELLKYAIFYLSENRPRLFYFN